MATILNQQPCNTNASVFQIWSYELYRGITTAPSFWTRAPTI